MHNAIHRLGYSRYYARDQRPDRAQGCARRIDHYRRLSRHHRNRLRLSAYNLAIGGANLKTNYIQLEHYLKNNNKPKLVLLGLSSLTAFDKIKNDESVHPIVAYNYNLIDWSEVANIPMIKFKWLATEMLKTMVSKDHRDAKIVNGQYKTTRKVVDDTKYNRNINTSINDSSIHKLKYLIKIDSICNKNSVQLYILDMPGFKSTQNKFPLEFRLLIDEHRESNVINLNNKDLIIKLLDNRNDWLGNSHLNKYGAEKVTKYIFDDFLVQSKKLNTNKDSSN